MTNDTNIVDFRRRRFEQWMSRMPKMAADRRALLRDLSDTVIRHAATNNEFVIAEALAITLVDHGACVFTNGKSLLNVLCCAIESHRFEDAEFDAWLKAGVLSYEDKGLEVYDGVLKELTPN